MTNTPSSTPSFTPSFSSTGSSPVRGDRRGVSRRGFLASLGGAAAAVALGGEAAGATPRSAPTAADVTTAPAALDLDDIQGNILAGFSTNHIALVFITFADAAGARRWLAVMQPHITSTSAVQRFRATATAAAAAGVWTNIAITHRGLAALGRPNTELRAFPTEFVEGMRARADVIGDHGVNDATNWPTPYQTDVDAVLILGADQVSDMEAAITSHQSAAAAAGVTATSVQRGAVRADQPGHEHFGFRDGISQPGIRGFTTSTNPSKPDEGAPGQDLLWPGEFVLGHPGQPGVGGGESAGPIARSGPDWTTNGSYMVLRRLRQDVAGFRTFVAGMASAHGMSTDLAGAKLIGRYQSGAPLEVTGAVAADPASADPSLTSDARINDFEYGDDPNGAVVPLCAHIRKAYPRDEPTRDGGEEDTQTHRILRRGIPFGASLPLGTAAGDALASPQFPDDRGLLFICYQTSIAHQFEFIQRRWFNDPNFPRRDSGVDPIVSTRDGQRSFVLPGGRPDHIALMEQFVTTTGGDYFLQPSLSAISMLAAGEAAAITPTTT
ncbi:MAG TPA: Dyp-type peroxidase, partial [Ilumatobacteraceae bacterium]